MILDVWAKL